ncbi:MAG TPA: hypothetical protein VIE43_07760 [Thermoanaerobaculia bacterium]|jgi:hypothetical protein|nr:hypothetical protein [Thermoanaerobaculia bacterium]
MSRFTVARRLTAVLALLAAFCLPMPAAARSHRNTSPATSPISLSLRDQFLAWLGLGPGSTATRPQASSVAKSTSVVPPAIVNPIVESPNASYGSDPNGHS